LNVADAAYETVHSYPGGSGSLGPRVGINSTVLNSKVNPNTTTHQLALAEADRIMGMTGDHRILHALAAQHGYALVRIEADDDTDILAAVLNADAAKGDLSTLLREALKDKKLTAREFKGLAAASAAAQAALVTLMACARALVPKAGQGP
jgi:hypothetical protein